MKDTEGLYKQLVEAAAEGACVTDSEGNMTFVNAAMTRLLGYGEQELLGKSLLSFMDEAKPAGQGIQGSRELKWKRKDGSELSFAVRVVPLHPGNGGAGDSLWMLTDVGAANKARQELRSAVDWFRSVFENAPIGMAVVTMEGCFLEFNPAFRQFLGYSEEELVGKTVLSITHPEDRKTTAEVIRQVAGGAPAVQRHEKRYLHKNGAVKWGEVAVALVRDAEGRPLHTIAQVLDVTERKKAEERISKLAMIVNTSEDAVISTDPEGIISIWNPAAERLFGYRAEEAVGRPILLLATPESRRAMTENRTKVLAGQSVRNEGQRLRKDGSRVNVSVVLSPIKDAGGTVVGISGVFRDISERKKAEEALKEAYQLLDSIIENMPTMLFVKDARELRFVRMNKTGEELLGLSRKVLIGKNDYDFFPKEDADFFTAKDRETLSGDRVVDIPEEPIKIPGGGERLLHTKKMTLRGASGEPKYLLGISEDITERKRIEQLKNDLILMISHDLSTPLSNIAGSLNAVGEMASQFPRAARELLAIAQRNVATTLRLLNDFLAFKKLESGELPSDMAPLELTPLVEHALEINRPYGERFGVSFVLAEGLPGARVLGDGDRLTQVISNLLSNAAKHSPRDSAVTVRVARRGKLLRVSITDLGPGIPEDFLPRVFLKFSQASPSGKPALQGVGLGLSIAKALVENHKGAIGFETNAGRGTTFYFDLPELLGGS